MRDNLTDLDFTWKLIIVVWVLAFLASQCGCASRPAPRDLGSHQTDTPGEPHDDDPWMGAPGKRGEEQAEVSGTAGARLAMPGGATVDTARPAEAVVVASPLDSNRQRGEEARGDEATISLSQASRPQSQAETLAAPSLLDSLESGRHAAERRGTVSLTVQQRDDVGGIAAVSSQAGASTSGAPAILDSLAARYRYPVVSITPCCTRALNVRDMNLYHVAEIVQLLRSGVVAWEWEDGYYVLTSADPDTVLGRVVWYPPGWQKELEP